MDNTPLPSERKFGLVFLVILGLLSAWGYYRGWSALVNAGLLAAAIAFGGLALVAPAMLGPLNRAWFRLGELMGRIVSPIVLGVIFYGVMTPVALVGRIAGRDELRMRRRDVETYWIDRDPPGPAPDSFKNQF